MTNKELQDLINSASEKLGKENSALVSDVFGTMISDNAEMNKTITNKDKQIEYRTVTGDVFKSQITRENKPLVFYIGVYHPKDIKTRGYFVVDLISGMSFAPFQKKTKKEAINSVLNHLIYKTSPVEIYNMSRRQEPVCNDEIIKKLDESDNYYRLI